MWHVEITHFIEILFLLVKLKFINLEIAKVNKTLKDEKNSVANKKEKIASTKLWALMKKYIYILLLCVLLIWLSSSSVFSAFCSAFKRWIILKTPCCMISSNSRWICLTSSISGKRSGNL